MKSNVVLRVIAIIFLAGAYVLVKLCERVFGQRIWITLVLLVAAVGLWLRFRASGS